MEQSGAHHAKTTCQSVGRHKEKKNKNYVHAQREMFLMRDSFGPWELGLVTPQGVLIIWANSTHNKYIEHGLCMYMDSITLNPKESNKCRECLSPAIVEIIPKGELHRVVKFQAIWPY